MAIPIDLRYTANGPGNETVEGLIASYTADVVSG
jgi:hypothetical protein